MIHQESVPLLPDSPKGQKRGHGGLRQVTLIPLITIIFFEVSGGPFGTEDAVSAAGPLLTILGFLIFPIVWSIPEALITAELATAFPENSGYVAWVTAAFGPFWGFQEGLWSWLSGVTDNSLYPVMLAANLQIFFPQLQETGWIRNVFLVGMCFFLSWLNYRGLTVVGLTAVTSGLLVLSPFIVLIALCLPQMQWSNLVQMDLKSVDWPTFLNVMFWNLNYWDGVSTLAGEVEAPAKTLPRALLVAVLLVVLAYVLPLVASLGVLGVGGDWELGYFATVADTVGGRGLALWVVAAAAASQVGQYQAEMASDSYQVMGMSERGFLPKCLGVKSRHNTPTIGILLSSLGVLMLATMSFTEIVTLLNAVYCLAELLEFAAFLKLRYSQPHLIRPYKVPLPFWGCVLMVLPASALLMVVLAVPFFTGDVRTCLWTAGAVILGFVVYPLLEMAREGGWMEFNERHFDIHKVVDCSTTGEKESGFLGSMNGLLSSSLVDVGTTCADYDVEERMGEEEKLDAPILNNISSNNSNNNNSNSNSISSNNSSSSNMFGLVVGAGGIGAGGVLSPQQQIHQLQQLQQFQQLQQQQQQQQQQPLQHNHHQQQQYQHFLLHHQQQQQQQQQALIAHLNNMVAAKTSNTPSPAVSSSSVSLSSPIVGGNRRGGAMRCATGIGGVAERAGPGVAGGVFGEGGGERTGERGGGSLGRSIDSPAGYGTSCFDLEDDSSSYASIAQSSLLALSAERVPSPLSSTFNTLTGMSSTSPMTNAANHVQTHVAVLGSPSHPDTTAPAAASTTTSATITPSSTMAAIATMPTPDAAAAFQNASTNESVSSPASLNVTTAATATTTTTTVAAAASSTDGSAGGTAAKKNQAPAADRYVGVRPEGIPFCISNLGEMTVQLESLAFNLASSHDDMLLQRMALMYVEGLVRSVLPDASLHLVGSAFFGLSMCYSRDIDVVVELPVREPYPGSLERIYRAAVGSGMQKVKHQWARTPMVRFTHPQTGVKVILTLNRRLSILNSDLIRNYLALDPRLRKLALIVKHWAKQRRVNDPFRGTFSTYAYMLLVIQFLQTRQPPLLPNLQDVPRVPGRCVETEVDEWQVNYSTDVTAYQGFGAANTSTLAELVVGFFDHWAWQHDYNGSVVSVRVGGHVKKEDKNWTKRQGSERHLVSVEDPFDLSRDLGRNIDRSSVMVLRREFERAALIFSHKMKPLEELFEIETARQQA